jgi:hypothetical protein
MKDTHSSNERRRIGPWRLLDIVTATMPLRSGTFMAAAIMPEYGPPDAVIPSPEPVELPNSNISDLEREAAVRREAARRFLRRGRGR